MCFFNNARPNPQILGKYGRLFVTQESVEKKRPISYVNEFNLILK